MTLLGVSRLLERLLPDRASCFAIQCGEKQLKHLGVPVDRVTLDALLDVLQKQLVMCHT